MPVDHDVSTTDLIDGWVNGNRSWVIDNLKLRHPAITATVIVQGSQNGDLDRVDCNNITNLLMDDLVEIRDSLGIKFTGRSTKV